MVALQLEHNPSEVISGPHSVPRPLWVGLISPGRQNKLPGGKEGMWLFQEEGAPGLPPVSSAPGLMFQVTRRPR